MIGAAFILGVAEAIADEGVVFDMHLFLLEVFCSLLQNVPMGDGEHNVSYDVYVWVGIVLGYNKGLSNVRTHKEDSDLF